MPGLVLDLICHIGDSSAAGNKLRSSRMLEFLAVLVLLVPCTFLFFMYQSAISRSFRDILAQPPSQAARPWKDNIHSGCFISKIRNTVFKKNRTI